MGTIVERFQLLIETKAEQGLAGLRKFRTEIAEADGFTGKFKAGAKGLGDAIKANAGPALLAGGAALAAFGAKAVAAFEDTAKAAIDLGSATGLSTEAASRWIAVGDDFQVSAEQLQAGVGKLAKTLDDEKWSKYGIATRDAAGEARDANDILIDSLAMLSETQNATERARIGNELFGKGYANLAPLIGHTAAEYRDMLGAVDSGQVITKGEADRAEKMRLAQDRLSDALGRLGLAFGEMLTAGAPVLDFVSVLAEKAGDVAEAIGPDEQGMSDSLYKFSQAAEHAKGSTAGLLNAFTDLIWAQQENQSVMDKGKDGVTAFFGELADRGTLAAIRMEDLNAAFLQIKETSPQLAWEIVQGMRKILELAENGSGKAADQAREWVAQFGLTEEAVRDLGLQISVADLQGDSLNRTMADGVDIAEDDAKAKQKAAEASKRRADAVRDELKALDELYDRERSAIDRKYAFRKSQDQLAEATDNLNKVMGDSKSTQEDVKRATDSAADAAIKASEDYATLNGASLTSAAGVQRQIESLEGFKNTLAPDSPLRKFLDEYIADLRNIPPNIATTLQLKISQGQVGSKDPNLAGTNPGFNAGKDGPQYRGATGAIVTRPTRALIGEAGPEAVVPLDQAPGASPVDDLLAMIGGKIERGEVKITQHIDRRQIINYRNSDQTPTTVTALLNKWNERNGYGTNWDLN